MSELSAVLLAGMAGGAARATAVLAIAWLLTRMRGASAAQRHVVWAAALAGVLVLPAVSPFLPEIALPADDAWVRQLVPVIDPSSTTIGIELDQPGRLELPSSRMAEANAAPVPIDWRATLLVVWFVGALVVLGRLVAATAAVARLNRGSSPITDSRILRTAREICDRLGVRQQVRLLSGNAGSVPMMWGIFRPTVLLPPEASRWSQERLTVVLTHELAHARRWDSLTQWLAHLAAVVYWFHPLVWVAGHRLHEERERACDDAVLRLGTKPANYADHLLELVRMLGPESRAAAAIALARPSRIEGRMLAILDRTVAREVVTRRAGVVILSIAAGCVLLVGAVRVEGSDTRSSSVAERVPIAEVAAIGSQAAAPAPDPSNASEAGGARDAGPPRGGNEIRAIPTTELRQVELPAFDPLVETVVDRAATTDDIARSASSASESLISSDRGAVRSSESSVLSDQERTSSAESSASTDQARSSSSESSAASNQDSERAEQSQSQRSERAWVIQTARSGTTTDDDDD